MFQKWNVGMFSLENETFADQSNRYTVHVTALYEIVQSSSDAVSSSTWRILWWCFCCSRCNGPGLWTACSARLRRNARWRAQEL